MTYKRLAEVLGGSANTANLGRKQEALDYLLRALEIRKALASEFPGEPELVHLVAQTYHSIGEWHYNWADLPRAIENAQEALALRRQLVVANELNQQYRRELAIGISSNGTLLLTNGDGAGALRLYQEALPLYQKLAQTDATNETARRDLTLGLRDVGTALYHVGEPDRGRAYFERAYPQLHALIASDPSSFYNRRQLVNTHLKHAAGAALCDLPGEHAEHSLAALEAAESLLADFPENPVARTSLATAGLESARALESARPAEALRLYAGGASRTGGSWNRQARCADSTRPDPPKRRPRSRDCVK